MVLEIGVFGEPRGESTGYLDLLRERFNAKLVFSPPRSELERMSGLILLDPSRGKEILELLGDETPTLIEIPFATSLQEEVRILSTLSQRNQRVIIPLYSRHNPKLLRLSSLLRENIIGKASSIYVTIRLNGSLLRREPPGKVSLPGEITHQLVNTVDLARSLGPQKTTQYRAWLLSGGVLAVDARVDENLATVVSYASPVLRGGVEAEVCVEAVGSEGMIIWDGSEQSLMVDDGGYEFRYWGLSLNDVIAQHFIELIRGRPLFSLKDLLKSYEDALKIMESLRRDEARR